MLFSQFLLLGNIPENIVDTIYFCYIERLLLFTNNFYAHGQHHIMVRLGMELKINKKSLYTSLLHHCDIDLVKRLLHDSDHIDPEYNPMFLAVKYNNCELIQILLDGGYPVDTDSLVNASSDGHNEILKLLLSQQPDTTEDKYSVSEALYNNHLDTVDILLSYGYKIEDLNLSRIFYSKNLSYKTLKYIVEHGYHLTEHDLTCCLIHCRSIRVLKLFMKYGVSLKGMKLRGLYFKSTKIVKFLYEQGVIFTRSVYDNISDKHDTIVKLLILYGVKLPRYIPILSNCNIQFVKFLLENKVGFNPKQNVIDSTIQMNDIQLCKFMMDKGAHVCSDSVKYAVSLGRDNFVKLFISTAGISINKDVMNTALETYNLEIIFLLARYGLCPDRSLMDEDKITANENSYMIERLYRDLDFM